jgi:hypothetical protein
MLLDYVNETIRSFGFNNVAVVATAQQASQDWANTGDGEFSIAMQIACLIQTVANLTSFQIQAEESPTGTGSWTIIGGVNSADYGITQMILTVTGTTTAANEIQAIMGLRTQRYVRMNVATYAAGTTTGSGVLTGFLISGRKYQTAGAAGSQSGFSASPSTST